MTDIVIPTLRERPRRLRHSPTLRRMVRETTLTVNDLIAPLFVMHGRQQRVPVPSMPGVVQHSVDTLAEDARKLVDLGIPAVLLFGLPAAKDDIGSESFADDGIIQQAVRALKQHAPELVVITDVCLCEYTAHGHCGVLDAQGVVINDATLELIGRIAVSHAAAGADIVAPSGMMDGMVATIRTALDAHGFSHTPILSYAVKYASAMYGPFRDAAGGAPAFGDRRTHQMDPANAREALREAELDVREGADLLMVKPALAYLDVITRVRERYPDHPLVAYNVSGEYAMVKAAGAAGWIDEHATTLEILHAIKRAGADLIITYHASEVAQWLRADAR